MKFTFPTEYAQSPEGTEAARILKGCVHCGICTAVCPTYRVLGNELDSPRGRIYLIKGLLEGGPAGADTRLHLDRCLTCGACQTTCPSGVEYQHLLEIGRHHAETLTPSRLLMQRLMRFGLLALLPYPRRFRLAFRAGALLRRILPASLRPLATPPVAPAPWPAPRHARRVVILTGCVQPTLAPNFDATLAHALDRLGVSAIASRASCCGAMDLHLGQRDRALACARRNVIAWAAHLDAGADDCMDAGGRATPGAVADDCMDAGGRATPGAVAEALVSTASGCAAMVKEYAYLLREDPEVGAKAARVTAALRDPAELLASLPLEALAGTLDLTRSIALHIPCTQQHGVRPQVLPDVVLRRLGFTLTSVADPAQCCGAGGSFFLLQKDLAAPITEKKVDTLLAGNPQLVATGNIGCALALRARMAVPVVHWLELLVTPPSLGHDGKGIAP
jgi:glycolate oxidase iron-sulfur subunit